MANTIDNNKKARSDNIIMDEYEAGISRKGWEVKSLREGKGNIKESYATVKGCELILIGAHISPLQNSNVTEESDSTRTRKLLKHRREINKIKFLIKEKGHTLVPLSMYWKNGHVKLSIGIAKGGKKKDKRSLIKEREWKRQSDGLKKLNR
jgi:SsrA-binding protein